MNTSLLNIYIRVIKRKIENGESFDTVIKNYPKLTKEEILEIKRNLSV